MRKLRYTFQTQKRSLISSFSIYMTVSLTNSKPVRLYYIFYKHRKTIAQVKKQPTFKEECRFHLKTTEEFCGLRMQNFQGNFSLGNKYTRVFSNVQRCNFNVLSIILGLSREVLRLTGILCSYIIPFQTNVPFLYPLKTSRKTKMFRRFQW